MIILVLHVMLVEVNKISIESGTALGAENAVIRGKMSSSKKAV